MAAEATRQPDEARQWRRRWLLIAGLCAVVGVVNGLVHFVRYHDHKGLSLSHAIGIQGTHWMLWAALFPAFHFLVRRFPLDAGDRLRSAGSYLLAAPLLILAHGVVYLVTMAPVYRAFLHEKDYLSSHRLFIEGLATLDVSYRIMGFAFLLAATWALEYRQRSLDAVLRATQLEGQLAQARLEALKMQLHPHFLFNTLNSVSALLHKDKEAADRMLARLGDFLRLTLDSGGKAEVSLAEEMRFVRCYLAIEEVRFSDRLTTRFEIDPEAEDAAVPNLVLQPLVENAIKHGVGKRTGPGQIVLRATRKGRRVELAVSDDGSGDATAGVPGNGVGLANTAARLRALYGDDHHIQAGPCAGGGYAVVLDMPYRSVAG